ncbi:MAG: hypothetical protein ACR2N3_15640 [Pyrinomonadaceae bacterium]
MFGNNFLPLAAMSLRPAEDCQMACCRLKRHSKNSSMDSCPMMNMMNEKNVSRKSMMSAEKSGKKNLVSKKQAVKTFENAVFKIEKSGVPIYYHQNRSDSDDNQNILFLNAKPAGRCDQTTCAASSSFSNIGKRSQQSYDNCAPLSFADKPPRRRADYQKPHIFLREF